jgi:hypothetical protein
MDIEHFSLLSSVIRKTESHEQDGETLRARARIEAASGDPAMAFSSSRLARTDLSVRLYSAAAHSTGLPPTMRASSLCMILPENRYPLFGIML